MFGVVRKQLARSIVDLVAILNFVNVVSPPPQLTTFPPWFRIVTAFTHSFLQDWSCPGHKRFICLGFVFVCVWTSCCHCTAFVFVSSCDLDDLAANVPQMRMSRMESW